MEEQNSSKKIFIIGAVVIILLIVAAAAFFFTGKSANGGAGTRSFGALFGNLSGEDANGRNNPVVEGNQLPEENGTTDGGVQVEPLFRQLSLIQTAGAIAVDRAGKTFVRYIARENGYVYDVDPKTGDTVQLTNTTIPRVYEALWGNGGNTVVIRYLKHDDLARKDIIKTQIANLVLPIGFAFASSSGDTLGSLSISDPQLPDNILSVSISPNGTKLFYLLPVVDGVSGTVVNMTSKIATEVFRNSFSEWLLQILDTGNIILTSKASADVAGYAYLYDTNKKTLTRLLRDKNGLTTLATSDGSRMLYNENLLGNTTLGLYDAKGFVQDEGLVSHTAPLQLATLPEKCVWSSNRVRVYCGAFASTPRAKIPDEWYRGTLAFTDTFWTMNTDLTDLFFLADPKPETGKTFDVFMPFIDKGEDHFYFVDKNDSTLWSMRLIKSKFVGSDELPLGSSTLPVLTPEEMKDALGSLPTTTKATSSKPKAK